MCICATCLSQMIQVHYAPTKATIRGGMRRGSRSVERESRRVCLVIWPELARALSQTHHL